VPTCACCVLVLLRDNNLKKKEVQSSKKKKPLQSIDLQRFMSCPGLDLQRLANQLFRPLCAICEPIFQGVLVSFRFPCLLLTAVTRRKGKNRT